MRFHSVEQNLRQSFRALAALRGSGEVREASGVTIASLGASFQMFNAAFLSSTVESESELNRRVMNAAVHFSARGLEWSYWLCDGWLDRKVRRKTEEILARHGLSLATEMPGMAADSIRPPERTLPRLDVRTVTNHPARLAFCEIGSLCFRVPLVWFQEIFDGDLARRTQFTCYVAYDDGQPVATAATVITADEIGVYNIATLPQFRRRGYGEAVMRFALDRAREQSGIERSVLQSTPQGLRMYQRMGYETVTKVLVFTS